MTGTAVPASHGGHDPSGNAGISPATVVTGIPGTAAAGGATTPGMAGGATTGAARPGAGITAGVGYATGWVAVCGWG